MHYIRQFLHVKKCVIVIKYLTVNTVLLVQCVGASLGSADHWTNFQQRGCENSCQVGPIVVMGYKIGRLYFQICFAFFK